MADDAQQIDASLYEHDFHAWLMAQAAEIRARRASGLDWDNLAEEVESLGRAQKNEIRSRLARLIHHLLKWAYQTDRRGRSWLLTIREQRRELTRLLEDSPSLRPFLESVLASAYEDGRGDAMVETGLASETFPEALPWSAEQLLDPGFLPGAPWREDESASD